MSLEKDSIKIEESTATVATFLDRIVEPEVKTPEKSERSWWRRPGPKDQENNSNLENSFELPSSPPTPTSPISSTIEHKRFEFVLPPRVKLLTLNDVFKIPQSISWNKNVKKTKEDFDFYKDTINVPWNQTIESLRHNPIYPHTQEETYPLKSSKVAMQFIGKQTREVPPASGGEKKGSGANFIPRKDAQEFRPSRPQVQDDYFSRTGKLLNMLQTSNKRETTSMLGKREMNPSQPYESYSSKRPVKPDSHNLPSYQDQKYADYVDRGKYADYPPSRQRASHERSSHHEEPQHNYAHPGYSESRPSYREDQYGGGRGDSSRERYSSHRQYDRESIARDYYDKERLYHHQNSLHQTDRRHMYDMQSDMPDILRRYQRRRQDPESYQRYRERGSYNPSASERISTYDEYERVVTQRQQRRQYHERRDRSSRAAAEPYMDDRAKNTRWQEYYRMKYEMKRRQNAY